MLRTPVEGQLNLGENCGSGRLRILKSHWKCSLTLIAIIFIDVTCGLESTTATPSTPVPFTDPRTRNKIDSSSYSQDNVTVCTSEECKRAAIKLKAPMNLDIDPCEDFYEYACGNWQQEYDTWFAEKQETINTIVREFLKKPVEANDPKPVQYAKDMYKNCMDTDNAEKQGLQPIIDILKSVGLPPFPTYGSSDHNDTYNFDWLETTVKIKTNLNLNVLIGSSLFTKYSINYLNIGLPKDDSMEFMRMRDGNNNGHQIISSKKSVVEQQNPSDIKQERYRKVLKLFARETRNNTELPAYIDIQSERFIRTDREIEKMIKTSHFDNFPNQSIHKVLQSITKFNQKYLDGLCHATGECSYNSSNVFVDINDISYLMQLAELFSKIPPREVELYMWMKVVLKVGRYATGNLRDIIQPQFSKEESRSKLCSEIVNVVPDPNFYNVTKPKISAMIHNAKLSLIVLTFGAEWMDADTRLASLIKIAEMKSVIGHSDSDKIYDDIHIDPSKHVLHNLVNMNQAAIKAMLQKLKQTATCDILRTTEVNAQFSPQNNCLDLSWAVLQYPFYDLGLESLNYGSIGFTVGHEMSHAFDNNGIQHDVNGNEYQWWYKDSTRDSFENKTSCFVDQYSSYKLRGLQINGTHTLGDNMADNNGVRVAFAALKLHLDGQTPEPKLPSFEHFSSEKLFFLSYANTFCGSPSMTLDSSDEHSPLRFRINGALQNNKDFAKAWNCKPSSYMNPNNKCILF